VKHDDGVVLMMFDVVVVGRLSEKESEVLVGWKEGCAVAVLELAVRTEEVSLGRFGVVSAEYGARE